MIRPVTDAAGLVNDMRQQIQTAPTAAPYEDRAQLERSVSARIATLLMMLLVMIIFVTSALPDVGPTLAKVVQTHL
jgi:hypothetical protein